METMPGLGRRRKKEMTVNHLGAKKELTLFSEQSQMIWLTENSPNKLEVM